MDRKEFMSHVSAAVDIYIGSFDRFQPDAQIQVNPVTLAVELVNGRDRLDDLADNEEAVEDASAAHGEENQDGADYQVKQNFDLYPVKDFVIVREDGQGRPDPLAIARLAAKYF